MHEWLTHDAQIIGERRTTERNIRPKEKFTCERCGELPILAVEILEGKVKDAIPVVLYHEAEVETQLTAIDPSSAQKYKKNSAYSGIGHKYSSYLPSIQAVSAASSAVVDS